MFRYKLRTLLIVFLVLQLLMGCAVFAWKAADTWIKNSDYGVNSPLIRRQSK
jgi:hypothetical protein